MKRRLPHVVSLTILLIAGLAGRLDAQPANDDCLDGTLIPGNSITYDPPFANTTGATPELCGAAESCEIGGVGTSNSVWYSFTPDQSVRMVINTVGDTNYDTVVSVFDGCGFFRPTTGCVVPNELACNDNSGPGTTSQISLNVSAGETYRIKVSDHDQSQGGGLLDFNLRTIPLNDLCSNATIVDSASYDPPLLSTHNADNEPCEAQESCEFNDVGVSNPVWFSVTSLDDGFVTIDTEGTDYDTVLSVFDGCREFIDIKSCSAPPTEIACDDDGGAGLQSMLVDVPIQGGQTYLIKVSDYNPSQGGGFLDFNLTFSETPVNPSIFADGFESADTTSWSITTP